MKKIPEKLPELTTRTEPRLKSSTAELAYQRRYRESHREARLAYNAEYYLEHRDALLAKWAKESAEFARRLQILRTLDGCWDCGTHGGRLDHHHIDPSTKKYTISQMWSYSLEALGVELEKCIVLCDACHRKRHVRMRLAASLAT